MAAFEAFLFPFGLHYLSVCLSLYHFRFFREKDKLSLYYEKSEKRRFVKFHRIVTKENNNFCTLHPIHIESDSDISNKDGFGT